MNGLPDPKGPLSLTLPSQAIALANNEVTKANQDNGKKHGQYKKILHNDRESCGVLLYTPGLHQQLPPIFLCRHGIHEYKLCQILPCFTIALCQFFVPYIEKNLTRNFNT